MIKKIFILLLLFSCGCASLKFYPPGDEGQKVQYKYTMEMVRCDYCNKETHIYKIVNGRKVMCDRCYTSKRDRGLGFR